jgi:putative addiction module component (TIGR02574 family)
LRRLEIDKLSINERIQLVQEIWDSLTTEAESAPISDELKAEIDRRLAAHAINPAAAIPWEIVEAEAIARISR